MFHLADISNPTKEFDVYKTWTDTLFNEFFEQGDLEKKANLPVSMFCDRDTTNIAKTQKGFLNFVIKPSYSLVCEVLPKLKFTLQNIDTNLGKWAELED